MVKLLRLLLKLALLLKLNALRSPLLISPLARKAVAPHVVLSLAHVVPQPLLLRKSSLPLRLKLKPKLQYLPLNKTPTQKEF
jgi:hypothetical protein